MIDWVLEMGSPAKREMISAPMRPTVSLVRIAAKTLE
jgi:hypothetical protein